MTESEPAPPTAESNQDGIPVILATDIGSDVDDTWALAQLLRTPELDLRLVITETGEANYRAQVAAKLLERAGRCDVQIGLGVDFGSMQDHERHQGPWVENYALDSYPGDVHDDGIEACVNQINESSEPVTIISIAPTPSLAAVIKRAPAVAEQCRFVGMHGSFYAGYGGVGEPDAETNVRVAPDALRTVFAADWQDIVITPLDTCGSVVLDGSHYRAIWSATDDVLARSVIENTCIFAPRVSWMDYEDFALRSSTLFDSVAVYLAHDESWVKTEAMTFTITDDGYTVPSDDGEFTARVALAWRDRDAFESYLRDVLLDRSSLGM